MFSAQYIEKVETIVNRYASTVGVGEATIVKEV